MNTIVQSPATQEMYPNSISVIDSHTEGEPTRVVVAGWPALRGADMVSRRIEIETTWDHLRRAVVCEPRGHDAVVGALLTEPVNEGSHAGVIFFNNAGCLGMCGHGLIGVVRTLVHLGRIGADAGDVQIDTPVGVVKAWVGPRGSITIRNVPSYVHELDVSVDVPGLGPVTGDIAWGGNWFFITEQPDVALELHNVDELLRVTRNIHDALDAEGITGRDGAMIDHIELTAPAGIGATCFVLCPGGAWDRSPCGTGTSAKLAVLHDRRQLPDSSVWQQFSITGGKFRAWYLVRDGEVHPYVQGHAWITGEGTLHFSPDDPMRGGFTTL